MQKPSPSPSPTTRQQLLDHGLAIATESGLRTLTVRGLCQRAGINTGSFVYHFGNRDTFTATLMEHWYAPLLQEVQLQFDQHAPPLLRLKGILHQLTGYVHAHGQLIAQMLRDAAAGEPAVVGFMQGLAPRHPKLILQCIIEAQQTHALQQGEPMHQMMFLMSAVALPVTIQHLLGGSPAVPGTLRDEMGIFAAPPHYIEQRLQWALRGLSPLESPSHES